MPAGEYPATDGGGGFAEEYLAAIAHAHAAYTRGSWRGLYWPAEANPLGGGVNTTGFTGVPGDRHPCWRGPTAPDRCFVPGGEAAGTGWAAEAASVEELAAAAAKVPMSATTLRLMRETRRAARARGDGDGTLPI